ncbi:MAG: PAS domain S-box protein [Rhodospirillales bacterium]|nr:PAS domain S-box protein [Rhodospirillales bacterium]
MFKQSKLGAKISISVGLILVALLFSAAGAFVYHQSRDMDEGFHKQAKYVLQVLEATHTQAMLNRRDKEDNNPVLDAFNATLDQLSESSKDMTLWLVMGPKVLAFQKKSGSGEIEPPQDEVDHEAMKTGKPVSRLPGDKVFRLTKPVVLGQGAANHKKCLECHGKDMGMRPGEVIGAFSIGLDVMERRAEFKTVSYTAFLIALLVSVAVMIITTGLLKRLAGAPINRMTDVMVKLAAGDLNVDVPDLHREDEIGTMSRAIEIFKAHALERDGIKKALEQSRDQLETRVEERTRALKESTQRQEAILNNAAEGIITADEDGLIETFNPTAERLFGYQEKEVVGRNLAMLMTGPDRDLHDAYIDNYLTTGEGKILGVRERELSARRKDGSFFKFELNVAEFYLGSQRKFMGTIRDITERQKAEEKSRRHAENQQLLQVAAKAANEARIVEVAMETCLVDVCAITGWPIGHAFFVDKEDPDRLVSSGLWYFDDPDRYRTFRQVTEELELKKGDGLPGRVLATGKPLWNKNLAEDPNCLRTPKTGDIGLRSCVTLPVLVSGQVWGVMEFFSDKVEAIDDEILSVMAQIGIQMGQVVERNEALEQLAGAMEGMEIASRAKTEFLASMSHELRTPLNSIIGFSEVIKNEVFGALGNPRYLEYVGDIHGSGQHLLELINDILDVSKIEAGAMELIDEHLDIDGVINDALRVVQGRAEDDQITLSASISVDLPELVADRVRVKQVLLNLLSNAVKFTPSGGAVSVSAFIDEDRSMVVSVTDTGHGIAEEEIQEILEPFTQAKSGHAKRQEGTGLGLYLSKTLMKEHGGTLKIESELGKGTTVTIRFPKSRIMGYLEEAATAEAS